MKTILYLFIVSVVLLSCKKEKILHVPAGTLLEVNEIKTMSKSQCISNVNVIDISEFPKYDVELKEIVYATEYGDKIIETSGILFYPVGVDTIHFVNYNHGTVYPKKKSVMDDGTPSLYKGKGTGAFEARNIGLAWASAGYAVFLPDYVGYNRSSKNEHPYIYYPELYKSIRDGLLATKEYFKSTSAYYDNRIFITGWSEGGGAALATHRFLQEKNPDDFDVIASLCLAGPYNVTHFLKYILEKGEEPVANSDIYSWAVYSVNKFSGLNRATNKIFSYKVKDFKDALNIHSSKPSKQFKKEFIEGIVQETDNEFISSLERTSTSSGWLPQGKVFLYHGDNDEVVPYFNAEDCYNGLTNMGGMVTLKKYSGEDHSSVFPLYVKEVKNQMDLLKQP